MWNTLLYLWETISVPWKAWLAFLSFLLGLWYAWLLWGPWLRRLEAATSRERTLLLAVANLRRQLKATSAVQEAAPFPTIAKVVPTMPIAPRIKGDSGLGSAALFQDLSEDEPASGEKRFGRVFRHPPERRDDFTTLGDVDEDVESKLNALGIYQFSQIGALSDSQIHALQDEDPSFKDVHWYFWRARLRARQGRKKRIVPGSVDAASTSEKKPTVLEKSLPPMPAKKVFHEKESTPPEAKTISLEEDVEAPEKKDAPIMKNPEEKTLSSEEAVVPLEKKAAPQMNKPPGVKAIPAPVLPSHFSGEDMTLSSKFGWVYNRKPVDADDFSLLAGMQPKGRDLLAKLGIHKYKQIAHSSDEQLVALEAQDPSLQGPEWSHWRTYFKTADRIPDIPANLQGRPLVMSPTLGLIYQEAPTDSDDLSQLHGIYPSLARKLKRLGIYHFNQIAALSDSQIAAWQEHDPALAKLPWKEWRKRFQASDTLKRPEILAGAPVKWSPQFGWIYPTRPKSIDSLALIEGVNEEEVAALQRLGIYQFGQLASWSDDELSAVIKEVPSLRRVDWSHWRQELRSSRGQLRVPSALEGEAISASPSLGWIYESKPTNSDDFTQLQGVSAETAKAWNGLGLYRFQQMASLSDTQLEHWQKQTPVATSFPWKAWRDRLRSVDKQVEIPAAFHGEAVQLSPELGVVYSEAPAQGDDFERLHDFPAGAGKHLHGLGIYRFRQLAHLDDSAMAHLRAVNPSLGAVDWKSWRRYFKLNGDEALQVPEPFLQEPVALSPSLGFVYRECPSNADALTQLQGVNPAVQTALNEQGLYRFAQIAQLSDAQILMWQSTDARFAHIDWEHWRAYFGKSESLLTPSTFVDPSIQHSPEFGLVYGEAPEQVDQLTLLHHVGESQAQTLHRLGIYQYRQIAHWSDATIQQLVTKHPKLAEVRWREWRERFITEGCELSVPAAFASDVVQLSPRFGVVYPDAPRHPDQLGLMDGMTPETEKRLHELGFYRFKQIGNLTDTQIDALRNESPELKRVGWNLWRAYYRIHGEEKSTALARIRHGVPMEFASQNHVCQHAQLGTVYRHAPNHLDRLTDIDGIDEDMERLLNGWGIYTYQQLAFLRTPQCASLAKRDHRFQGFRGTLARWRRKQHPSLGSHWRWKSWELSEADTLESDPELGAIFPTKPSRVDHLSLLPGVSGTAAALLKDLGIYQYAQVAQLTDRQVRALGKRYACLKSLDGAQLRFAASRHLGHLIELPASE